MKKKVIKKKVTKSNDGFGKETLINMVLDETGSMEICRDATISGFNEYIEALKKRKEKILFTLTKFDSRGIKLVCNSIRMADVQKLSRDTYVPGEMTPLYDAIAHTIKETENWVKIRKDIAVLTVIMTDGEENASRQYTRDKIFQLIKDKEKDGWTFVFLGANQDAWAIGQAIGLHKGNVMSYDVNKTSSTFKGLVSNTSCYLAANSPGNYTNFMEDRSGEDDKYKV